MEIDMIPNLIAENLQYDLIFYTKTKSRKHSKH